MNDVHTVMGPGEGPITRAALAAEFRRRFDAEPRVFRAPGRVNLIGEHTDHNQGFVFPVTTGLHTWLAIAPREDGLVRAQSLDLPGEVRVDLSRAQEADASGWGTYLRGVVLALQQEGCELAGADLLLHGDIPLGAGLSSSASLEVVVALGLLARAGASLSRARLAQVCQRAESEFVGVRCGIMDQFVIACSVPGEAMLLDCRDLQHTGALLPRAAHLVVIDSGVKHELRRGNNYNARRADCARAVAALQARWPFIESLRDADMAHLESVRGRLDEDAWRRARHVLGENDRVQEARRALETGDIVALGDLLLESHRSLREDYAVSCAELDELVECARNTRGVLGARMVGAGFGGCVLALLDARGFDTSMVDLLARAAVVRGRPLWHHVVSAAGPAGEIVASDAATEVFA